MDVLLKVALAGTAKHPGLPLDPESDADALLAAVPAEEKEHQFLLRAGAWSLHQQCGQVARTDVPRLEPAPPETVMLLSRRWVDILRETLTSGKQDLLPEFLRALRETNVNLPHELLPLALEQSNQELREALLPVLGGRGRWLSRFNPTWNWATQGDPTLAAQDQSTLKRAWEEGNLTQRRVALAALRRSDPDEARRWLEAALPQEKADHRAALVEQLRIGLGDVDEPLLERLLEDRGEQVRLQAAQLLRKLPNSQFAQRMRLRAEAMLQIQPRAKTFKLKCIPPEEVGNDWVRDGIPAKGPHGRGKRAFWAEMVLSSVPPSHWVSHFQKTPGELVAAVRDDDFAGDVLMAWTRAACGFGLPDPAWAEALWDVALAPVRKKKGSLHADDVHRLAALIKAMPAELAERNVEASLSGDAHHPEAIYFMVEALPRPWSARFARAYLEQARKVVASSMIDLAYEWTKSLAAAGKAIPGECFPLALRPWELVRPEQKSWTAAAVAAEVERFQQLVQIRRSFYEELQKAVSSPRSAISQTS